jgi:membrane-associated PAP2 superfamily phosphatase
MQHGDAPAPAMWWIAAPVLLAVILLAVEFTTDLDRTVSRFFVDPNAHAFPLRNSFWFETVMHQWAKYVVVTAGALIATTLVLSCALRLWMHCRRLLVFLLLSMALGPLSVTLGKAASSRQCPWDIDEFGGSVRYTRLFEPLRPGTPAGHCFPAGHATTGFAIMAFYFTAYALRRRQAARYALLIGVFAGVVLGFGRVVQGAHFASHVFWAGACCWMVMVALYIAMLAGRTVGNSRPVVANE